MRRASICPFKGGGANNISIGATGSGSGTSSGHTAATANMTTQATGSTFVVAVSWYNTSAAPTVTDNKSNTYTQIGSVAYNATDQTGMALYYCANGNGGATHKVTATKSASEYLAIAFMEVKGSSGVLDGTPAVGTASAGTSWGSGNTTTSNANDIIIGAGYCDSEASSQSLTETVLTNVITKSYNGVSLGIGLSAEIVSAAGTYASGWSGSPDATYGAAICTALKST